MSDAFDPYASNSQDRYEAMANARTGDGIVSTSVGYYLATAAAVKAGLRDVERFVGSFIDTAGLSEEDIPISAIPEPRHGPIWRIINTVVAGHRTAQAEPFIRELAQRLVDSAVAVFRAAGTVDLVATVVEPLPATVIAYMLGVPIEDTARFSTWSDELLEAQSTGLRPTRDGGCARDALRSCRQPRARRWLRAHPEPGRLGARPPLPSRHPQSAR